MKIDKAVAQPAPGCLLMLHQHRGGRLRHKLPKAESSDYENTQ
jgi:hypothetical protein